MLLVILLFFLIVFLSVKYLLRCRKMPPGPYGLPLIGYFPFLGERPGISLSKLSKKYGDIFTVNIFGDNYWILNSIETVEEAYVKHGDLFAGRWGNEFNMYALMSSNCSGVMEGDDWKTNHRITVNRLSFLGAGKSSFECKIHEFVDRLEKYIECRLEIPSDYNAALINFSMNTITTLTISKDYELDDSDYIHIRDWTLNIFHTFSYMNFHLGGIGHHIYLLLNRKNSCVDTLVKNRDEFRKFLDVMIEERIKLFNSNQCEDLLDYYLKEREGANKHLYHRKAINARIMELIMGGIETSSATLNHSLYLMASNPKIQEQVFKEINDTFGKSTLIFYSDIKRLPYTRAVISEIHRYVCLVHLITTHVNREPTKFFGYDVPARQKFLANWYAISRNPNYFKYPDEFNPENFLDVNGFYAANRAFMPFSLGIRKCLGAKLAEVEIFIAFTRLMQKYQWKLGNRESGEKSQIYEGLVRCVNSTNIRALKR